LRFSSTSSSQTLLELSFDLCLATTYGGKLKLFSNLLSHYPVFKVLLLSSAFWLTWTFKVQTPEAHSGSPGTRKIIPQLPQPCQHFSLHFFKVGFGPVFRPPAAAPGTTLLPGNGLHTIIPTFALSIYFEP
jgi:hypothetical protein